MFLEACLTNAIDSEEEGQGALKAIPILPSPPHPESNLCVQCRQRLALHVMLAAAPSHHTLTSQLSSLAVGRQDSQEA